MHAVLLPTPSVATIFQTVSYNSSNRVGGGGTRAAGDGSSPAAALIIGRGSRGTGAGLTRGEGDQSTHGIDREPVEEAGSSVPPLRQHGRSRALQSGPRCCPHVDIPSDRLLQAAMVLGGGDVADLLRTVGDMDPTQALASLHQAQVM
jgi:hypothetical protein